MFPRMHVDSLNLERHKIEALKVMKRKLFSWGANEYYGDRHCYLDPIEGRVLLRHCHGLDKDHHTKCIEEYKTTRILDFDEVSYWKGPVERIV